MELEGRPAKLLECLGIRDLYPPQREALEKGVLDGENLLVSTPTASGKTLIAALAMASSVEPGVSKGFYTVPLRSIAFEKKRLFEKMGECLGLRVATIVGDLEVPERRIEKSDIIVSTYEKMDSIIRKRPDYLSEASTSVIDELHYISDPKRGPIVEIIVSAFKHRAPHTQLIGLSATISNAEEIAEWMNAELVASEWRPVPLLEGVYRDGVITYTNSRMEPVSVKSGIASVDLAIHASVKGGQSIVFVQSRRKAVSLAKKIYRFHSMLDYDKEAAREASRRLSNTPDKTEVGEILAKLVSGGIAFHHAGLSNEQRSIVEDAFRSQAVNTIVATPTLAAGVNLPARYVVVDEYTRYEDGYRARISVSEYKQLAGRAGRPGYDEVGVAVIVAKHSDDPEELLDFYARRSPEPVTSKLANRRILRTVLLASIASGLARTEDSVSRFLGKTLYAHQTGSSIIGFILDEAVKDLVKWEMITRSGRGVYEPTRLGLVTSLLYLDPLTSHTIIDNLRQRPRDSVLGFLHLISMTDDALVVRVSRRDLDGLYRVLDERYNELIVTPECCVDDESRYLQALKTALLLEDWIEETPMNELEDKYGVGPGDVAAIVETSVWLTYSSWRISRLYPETIRLSGFLKGLEERLKYGVKEDVLELTRLKGVGRVRARLLYKHGFHSIEDLRKARLEDLVKVPTIGYIVAREILSQLGRDVRGYEDAGKEEHMREGILSYT